ncbi:PepSY-like domain-containing protein [Allomuricauda sp. NBRC 101325]|uniref:PepSY-like domain-containing protein n=1 Tax=Allomuricauda sp. NBRC 101325 TaxID=1113758 RepID=UPI0024A2733E|nr:PepSY-like domain-containing protein [Muricauda sp. NBRC 101325]GLU45164.1 hypothetical protein Musp01_27880 [Muricauda sp. NBRC 101325]
MKNKKLILGLPLVAVLGFGLLAFTGNSTVPEKVKTAFAKKFPNAKKIKWDKESETEWEAEFKMDGTEYSANFLADGTWKETEHEIKEKDIPAAVSATLKNAFSAYEIEEVEVVDSNQGQFYEFELEKGEENLEVKIAATGTVIAKKLVDEEQED